MRLVIALLVLCGIGVAQEQPWTAKWIGAPWSTVRDGAELDGSKPLPVFRREFEVKGKVAHAELRIAGLGQFEATVNGSNVGPTGFHQTWTDYRKTVSYQTYDVSKSLKAGADDITVMLGNGMYNVQRTKGRYTKFEGSFGSPKLIAELHIVYTDGRAETIGSGTEWKVARGPVLFSSIYGGEDYDARKDPLLKLGSSSHVVGWDAAMVVDGPGGKLLQAIAPEVELSIEHKPVVVTHPSANVTVYDLGQNFTGVPEILVHGPPGATLKLIPGELLKPDGTVSQASSGGPMWWSYTLSGPSDYEGWRPSFTYYGFRYIQAEWSNVADSADASQSAPGISDLKGIDLHSASRITGTFASSNQTLNGIHKLIVEAMHNNEGSIFTDCPHREKLGWLEETHLVADALLYNNDLRGLYAATAQNIADAQHDDGDVPTIAPQYTVFGGKNSPFDDSPEWGSASVLGQWAVYRFYGDRKALVANYAVMQKYVAFLESKAVDGIVAYGLGDWYDIGPGAPGYSKLTTLGVTGTLMLYEDAVAMQKIATAIGGKSDDARKYAKLAEKTKAAFNAKFYDAAQGFYDKGSQTAQAMPLALGIVPEAAKAKVLAKLIDDIKAHDDHVTTGEVGYPYLMRVLMDTGHNDLLLTMMLKKDPPSYGSQLAAGATALTEAWDANPKSSQDHFMLGAGDEWFYRGLGGIDVDRSRGYEKEIIIRPQVVAGVDWVKVSYDSGQGMIVSNWRRGKGETTYDITVPNGVRATVILPGQTQVVSGSLRVTLKDAK